MTTSALTIAKCLRQSSQLIGVSTTPRLDIELLLGHILAKSRTYLATWPDTLLTNEQVEVFVNLFNRRINGEPIAHLIGTREFWSLSLSVNNSTLIPRPDTELLIETVLQVFAQDTPHQPRKILDLGTGTGAIALALASENHHWQIDAVDKSLAAVQLAQRNAASLALTNVNIQLSDWFSIFATTEKFDLIVSNPPYIDPTDPHLAQGDLRFEPRSALVAEKFGLADLESIVYQSNNYLANPGWLLLEHGYNQGQAVRDLLAQQGYESIVSYCDYGGNERATLGKNC